jgi:hypothetical protein
MAKNTTPQEQTSAWIFRRALKDNKKYKNADEIWADEKFKNEIIGTKTKPGLYPEVNQDWVENYYKQQKKFLDEFSGDKFTEFSQDQNDQGGFMNFVSNLVTKKYGVVKKDSWDPADIWCVQNEKKVIFDIKKVIDSDKGLTGIEKLNTLLRTLFKERIVVGISLKQVTGESARYQEVNVKKGVMFSSGKHPYFEIGEMRWDLKLLGDGLPKNKGSVIKITIKYQNEKATYSLNIRAHPGGGLQNLTFAFQVVSAKAQIGSIPVNLLYKRLTQASFSFRNDHTKYPSTILEFNTQLKTYKKMFNKIKTKVDVGITTDVEFEKTILKMLGSKKPVISSTGHSKLMQLNFLYDMVSLSELDMNKVMTDIFFLAERRGEGFGPFGKIY